MARRPDTAARARRLLALLPLLKRGVSVPVAELARAVGCPVDEVAADLTTLTMCGVPPFSPSDMIELDLEGDTVTVYMEPPALDRPLRLTSAEARALLTALEAADYDPAGGLATKLLAATASTVSTAELERTVRAGAAPGGTADIYTALAGALDTSAAVRITYFTGSTGRTSERVVHPLRLVVDSGTWYLVAFCRTAGEERVFRLDRIRSAEVTDERFEPPSHVPAAVTPPADALPTAEIRFRPGSRLPDAHEWPGMTREIAEDGTALVRVGYQSVGWIARRVVAHLGDAEVIGPPEVRAAVRELAAHVLDELVAAAPAPDAR